MPLVRKFTKRARAQTRGDESAQPSTLLTQSRSVRYVPGTIDRTKISLPTELISTTNVQALTAPDINKAIGDSSSSASSSSSVHSSNDYFSGLDTGFLTADNSSTSDMSPTTPITPFSDTDSKDFFSIKSAASPSPAFSEPLSAPAIPQRAPSHSKKAHVALSRQRSFHRSMSPPPSDITTSSIKNTSFYEPTGTRDSIAMFSPSIASDIHPFTKELAKVNEVAEEFGSMTMVLDEEEQEMMSKGLQKFSVSDYIQEISGGVFEDQLGLNPWI